MMMTILKKKQQQHSLQFVSFFEFNVFLCYKNK